MTWEEYDAKLDSLLGVLGSDAVIQAKSLYPHKTGLESTDSAQFLSPAFVQFSHLVGDIKDVCCTKILADQFIQTYSGSAPVYMYVAEVYPSHGVQLASSETTAFIGWDIAAFFGTFQELGFDVDQGELNFQNVIREEIMTFIRDGKPDAKRWNTADVNTGIIGRDVTVTPVTSEYFGKCDLWKKYAFFNYSWAQLH